MLSTGSPRNSVLRLTPLAACVAAIFSLSAPAAAMAATTWTVNTCSEANSGTLTTGTLRYAVANAASGDIINMTGLPCSRISLQTGAIQILQDALTLNGPGMNKLVVTGKYNNITEHDRIFNHTGAGILTINNMSVSKGYVTSATGAAGGCIQSTGTIRLSHVDLYDCTAQTTNGGTRARGGALYAKNGLSVKYSIVSGNTADGGNAAGAYGGGIYALGSFVAKYSTISGNQATGFSGFGGGIFAYNSTAIYGSTISGNSTSITGGGIYSHNFFSSGTLTATIQNSTISGNHAGRYTGGMLVNSGTVNISNSSIVFNTASGGHFGASAPFTYLAPGLATDDDESPIAVTMQSSLIANNTYGTSSEYDLSVPKRASTTVSFSGSNNLVRATLAAVPAGTIKNACPLLGPLRDNGGLTLTHALLSHSPGIDVGNTVANLKFDQRGSKVINGIMDYPRPDHGTASDIGAYEVQQDDIVFNTGFETCPLLN